MERFEDRITHLDDFVTRTTSILVLFYYSENIIYRSLKFLKGKVLDEEDIKQNWYKESSSQALPTSGGSEFLGVDEDFENMEFVDGDTVEFNSAVGSLGDPASSEKPLGKSGEVTSSLAETIERFGLGSAAYRLEVSVPLNQEVLFIQSCPTESDIILRVRRPN